MEGAFARIAREVRAKRSPLVLGLDPRPDRLPLRYPRDIGGVAAFHERLIELVGPLVPAVKPQVAFFEAMGVDGLRLWARTCEAAHDAGLVVIGDVKRGDIGSTAEAYARAHFGWADVLTVNPYLGDDSLAPFLAACREDGKGIFVLCATSNPGWERFQGVPDAAGRPLYLRVADAIAEWGATCPQDADGFTPVGAVVGATHPAQLADLRARLPHAWLLVPGVGAQGATPRDVLGAFDARGLGALLPVSRGLAQCFHPTDPDWEGRVVASANDLVSELRQVLPHRPEP